VNEPDPFHADRKECNISVDHLHKWALREVEVWVLSVGGRAHAVAARLPGKHARGRVSARDGL
jgi:hypothetical protein